LGNTVPSLWSSGARLVSFILPALWLSSRPNFDLEELWYLGVASVALQAVLSYLLVLKEFRTRVKVVREELAAHRAA
jgi:Na+-driven multidrug efflux pump